jgi:hypothetical protein
VDHVDLDVVGNVDGDGNMTDCIARAPRCAESIAWRNRLFTSSAGACISSMLVYRFLAGPSSPAAFATPARALEIASPRSRRSPSRSSAATYWNLSSGPPSSFESMPSRSNRADASSVARCRQA